MNKKVSLVIINWNNKDYIEKCINSIREQTYPNIELVFIDNASKDGSFEFFQERFGDCGYIAIKNTENKGYSGGANQGIRRSTGDYIMIINPDIIMEKDFVEKLYRFAEANKDVGAVSGKLLKFDFNNDKKLNYIDSTGIIMFRDRNCIDRGQNEVDLGQYNSTDRVFGVCGAAPFYRKEALDSISINGEYFDEDFFAYKEDVDVSWRLNLSGFKCMYYHEAVAYHGRALGRTKGGIIKTIKHRAEQSKFLRGLSFRNQLLMLFKNENGESYRRDRFKIYVRVAKLLIFSLIFEQFNLKYLVEALKMKNKMLEKKLEFQKKNKKVIREILDVIS
jgi:GT2 family glycosyltransferase